MADDNLTRAREHVGRAYGHEQPASVASEAAIIAALFNLLDVVESQQRRIDALEARDG